MNALRLSAAATAVAAILAAAAALGACSTGPVAGWLCYEPSPAETGADGGPDPCHCAPPPDQPPACDCRSTPEGTQEFNACMAMLANLSDAGDTGEGGPIPGGCTGQCWPIPPPNWTTLLLWVGMQSSAPPCPEAATAPVYGGYASGSFALACTSNASGTCPGLGDVCGPEVADGFWTCIFREGDVDCPLVGPYIEKHVFYEVAGNPIEPSTFCCPAAPLPPW